VPHIARAAGYVALATSPLLALPLGALPFACALACAVLSTLYSHPRTAWKGHPVLGPLVNGLGYGTLSPIAGWAAASGVFTWRAVATLALIALAIFAIYFAAQAFQRDEDTRRGYHTLVVTHGPRVTLAAAHMLLRITILGALALAAIGVYPRVVLASAPAWLWADRFLARWRSAPEESRAGGLMLRLSAAGIATLLAIYAQQAWHLWWSEPPGGCGTEIVPAALLAACSH
jgi:4-hydroxybenzoate polyprenyltransferase